MNERSPPRFSPRLPRPLMAATRAGRWSLLAMLSAVLVGGFLLVLFWQQLQVRTPLNQALRDLRQARIELVTGDLYLTLAARPDATLQAAQGMALVRQSLQALETIGQSVSRELVAAGEPAPSDLAGPVDALRVQLARQNADSAVQALELRLAMQAVDRSAARLDEQLNDWLQRLRAQHERLFLESLMVAAGLLVALAGALALHFRAQRRHAGALIRYHEDLEAQVAARTQELSEAMHAREVSEHFVRFVADRIPGRLAYWDADMVCRFVNRGFAEWIGRSAEEAVGRHVSELLTPSQWDSRASYAQKALAGESQRFEIVEPGLNGTVVHTDVHYSPDWQDGQVRGMHLLAVDISAAKRAEQALRALNGELAEERDRADSASRAKSAFLANMSHEIRTPMSAILGLTFLLQRDIADPAQHHRLGQINDAATHLLQVINDILDLSKIESGKLELEHTEFSLDQLLDRTIGLVSQRAQEKGLELVLDTDSLPDWLVGDPTRVAQALINLLGNAIKFSETGCVVLRGERIGMREGEVQVRFEVRDNGVGIAPDKLGDIFNAFEQADATTTRRFGGTGLGLSITRRIAETMGGDVGVASVPGQGSRFWFTAWLGTSQRVEAPRRLPLLQGRRVLLVDDQPDAREALGAMLQQLGLSVQTVDSGAAALAQLQQAELDGWPFQIVLIDWLMPEMDGIDTLTRWRRANPESTLRALLISASDPTALQAQALQAGFQAVLGKPITASVLHDSLVRLNADQAANAPRQARPMTTASAPGELDRLLRERHAGALVLLAEDNPVNQEVATELLRRVGLRVDVANQGGEAVARATQRDYALILMDVQMPEVDGLEATRRIRRLPRHERTPILAMTANAFFDDRQACLEAGMDDHVGKPVDPNRLYASLLQWLPLAHVPVNDLPVLPAAHVASSWHGLDAALGVARCGGSPVLWRSALQRFRQHHRHSLTELGDAVVAGDWSGAAQIAHELRGAASTVGASEVEVAAIELEEGCRNAADLQTLLGQAAELQRQLERLMQTLAALETPVEGTLAAPQRLTGR